MRVLINPFFGLLLFVGMFIYSLQKFQIQLPVFIHNYANDFIIMPLVLWVVLAFLIEIKGVQEKVTWLMALILVVYYSLFFECYLPQYHYRYTADLFDVICYLIGMLMFMLFQNKIKKYGLRKG